MDLVPEGQSRLQAEVYLSGGGGRNHGQHLIEGGSRYQRQGSRISYLRNFNFGTIGAGWQNGSFDLGLHWRTTAWYVDPGGARDEDFDLDEQSQSRNVGLDFRSLAVRDSAYTISGTRNFADAWARSSMIDHAVSLPLRYYPGGEGQGLYAILSLRYLYFHYRVYDAIQYLEGHEPLVRPIGFALTFENQIGEVALGAGYRHSWGPVGLDGHLQLLAGKNRNHDYHAQRLLHFIVYDGLGNGFLYSAFFFWQHGPLEWRMGAYGHRYYSSGLMRTSGGRNRRDLESNFLGPYLVQVNTKEGGGEFSVIYRL